MTIWDDPALDALVADVEFLLSVGEHPAHVARRLGRTTYAIDQVLRRRGRGDLATHFSTERDRHG